MLAERALPLHPSTRAILGFGAGHLQMDWALNRVAGFCYEHARTSWAVGYVLEAPFLNGEAQAFGNSHS